MGLTAIFGFLQSTVGKVILYMIAGLLAFGALTTAYLKWEHKVQEAERYRIENVELHQTIKQQDKTIADQKNIMQQQEVAAQELNLQLNAIRETEQQVDMSIDTSGDDRPSSEVLKNVFRQLYPEPKK